MGTSNGPQEQQVRDKVQKGWLSRWTRKQWSRHWFVLKNGSITYYRGPAAELCSFLDGVLDLSLIKHIEVAPQVEKARPALTSSTRSQNYAFNYQQNLSQYQQQQQQQQHQQQNHHQQQQQQQQVNSRFDFTLKMWNGECHLLSAASAAERQSWLAAIHSCGSFDDSTSDSSASSDSSMSAKSTDIGKPTSAGAHVGAARNAPNTATSTSSPAAQTHAAYLNSYQAQQQQDREAELSLEQLAFRLKSVVRRNNSSKYQEQEAVVEKHKEQKQQQQNSSQIREQQQTKPTSQALLLEPVFCTKVELNERHAERNKEEPSDGNQHDDQQLAQVEHHHNQLSSASDQEAPLASDRAEHQAHKRNLNGPESASEPKLLKLHADSSQTNTVERSVAGRHEEAQRLSIKGHASSGLDRPQPIAGLLRATSSERPALMQRQKKRVTFDLSSQDLSNCARIERDLSSSSASSSDEQSCSSSPSTSSDEAEDEPEEKHPLSNDTKPRCVEERLRGAARSSSGSISSLSSSGAGHADRQARPPNSDKPLDKTTTSSSNDGGLVNANTSQLLDLEQIREIEQRRKLELKRQLSYSNQKANDEDEDSTCELVRRMIERRKLRLLNKQQQQQQEERETDGAPIEGPCGLEAGASRSSGAGRTDKPTGGNSSATSGCQMETNEEVLEEASADSSPLLVGLDEKPGERTESSSSRTADQADQADQAAQLQQLNHISQLEDRLKSAQLNIEHLERRLNDSYFSYSQLELSHSQLQVKLVECQQLHSSSLMQTQSRIDELSRELEASELKLLEAKEKLLKYEEHLAKWQHQSQAACAAPPESNPTTSPAISQPQQQRHHSGASRWAHQKTASWLMKNSSYLAAAQHNLNNNHIGSHLIASQHQEQVNQPLLLVHQLKQTISMNQQQLSLKLLNQSKQIQRKLNELELKVDRIQATDCKHFTTRPGGQPNLSAPASEAAQ